MGKREGGRKGWRGLLYPPHAEKSCYRSKTRNIQENPVNSRKFGDSEKNLETPAFQGQHSQS
jgi:hypothetical protein